jgi:hypothetical protein
MAEWPKSLVKWTENDTAYLSVVFTWDLPQAYMRAVWLKEQGYEVKAGGPACLLMPDYLSSVARVNGEAINALWRHNPNATFTSRGCIRKCPFCAVPKIEGDLVELDEWEPKPIVCDNNLLACSQKHFDKVIDSLKGISSIDFNQGLDARLLTKYHADRLAELDLGIVRLAWDNVKTGNQFMRAYETLRNAGIPRSLINVYVLIGFDDTPDDALFRLRTVKNLGSTPFPQRYQPLDSLAKNQYISPQWAERELKRFSRYWARQAYLRGIPFEEYNA